MRNAAYAYCHSTTDHTYDTNGAIFPFNLVTIINSMKKLLIWNIYQVSSRGSFLNGVSLRGRLRKLGIEKNINVLTDNAEDGTNIIRFATLSSNDAEIVSVYLKKTISDVDIELKIEAIPNPVLSKLSVNETTKYKL